MQIFKQNIHIAGFLLMLLIYSCSNEKTIPNSCVYDAPKDAYAYPILPGTQAWIDLQTTENRWQATQIPHSVLTNISAKGLIESWLNFPFRLDIFLTNSYQKATEYMIAHFSGLQELFNRPDAAHELLERYKLLNPDCVSSFNTSSEKVGHSFTFAYLELLIAQEQILSQMNLSTQKQLVKEAYNKYQRKLKNAEYFDVSTRDFGLLIGARVMFHLKYPPFMNEINANIQNFMENAQFRAPSAEYDAAISIIKANILQFIN